MICSVIDKFIKKDLIYGLNIVDDEYSKEYNFYINKLNSLKLELEELSNKFEEKDYAKATRAEAIRMRDELNSSIK